MYERVSNLLKDDQDLLLEFTNFLPEMGAEHQRVRNESSRPVPPTQIQISPSSSAIKRESTGSASEIASPGLSTSGHQVAVRESPGSSSTPPTQKSSPSSQRPYTPSNASGAGFQIFQNSPGAVRCGAGLAFKNAGAVRCGARLDFKNRGAVRCGAPEKSKIPGAVRCGAHRCAPVPQI